VQGTTDVNNLTPAQTKPDPYAGVPSRALIAPLMIMLERGECRPTIVSRMIEPVRAELHRREVVGWDDPFHPIHDPVTP
jgi:hypothetical protein